jgi:hypothetical protein
MEKGWEQLVIDNDTLALRYFGEAHIAAKQVNDTQARAQALLYMGICTYGVSYTRGMDYCLKAMEEYNKLERSEPYTGGTFTLPAAYQHHKGEAG